MDNKKDFDYSELCRLCLRLPGVDNLFEKGLVQDIYMCTGVKIIKSNCLPQKICYKCSETVTKAKELRILLEKNESHLKILWDNNVIDQDETDSSNSVEAGEKPSLEYKEESELQDDINLAKRKRSSSPENPPEKKIAVRKDLFKTKINSTSNGYTYVESIKYGITKIYTVTNSNEVHVKYKCAICPKTFTEWKKVYFHKRTHNKQLSCDICNKKFAIKNDLNKHMRVHTGEKPYSCNICKKEFSQLCTLKFHKENVHKEDSSESS